MSHDSFIYYKDEILSHYNRQCVYCGQNLSLQETELDHIVARTKGGKTRLSNVVPSCMPCNRKKSNNPPPIPIQLCFELTRYRIFPRVQQLIKKARGNEHIT